MAARMRGFWYRDYSLVDPVSRPGRIFREDRVAELSERSKGGRQASTGHNGRADVIREVWLPRDVGPWWGHGGEVQVGR